MERKIESNKITFEVELDVANLLKKQKASVYFEEDELFLRFDNWLMHFEVPNRNGILWRKEDVEAYIQNGGFSPEKPVMVSSNHQDDSVILGIATNPRIEYDESANAVGLKVTTVLWKWAAGETIEMLKLAGKKLRFSVTAFIDSLTCSICGHTFRPWEGETPCEHWIEFAPFYGDKPQIVDNSIIWLGHEPADPDARIIKKENYLEMLFKIARAEVGGIVLNEKIINEIMGEGDMRDEKVINEVPSHTSYGGTIDEGPWDADAAIQKLRKWASSDGSGDKDTIDWDKYFKGFGWRDGEKKDNFTSYKLPHHTVRDGKLILSKRGVVAALQALNGARRPVKIPDSEIKKVYNHLAKHYRAIFNEDPPDLKAENANEILESKLREENKEGNMQELEERLNQLEQENQQLKEELEKYKKMIEEQEKREKMNMFGFEVSEEEKEMFETIVNKLDKEEIEWLVSKFSQNSEAKKEEEKEEKPAEENVKKEESSEDIESIKQSLNDSGSFDWETLREKTFEVLIR